MGQVASAGQMGFNGPRDKRGRGGRHPASSAGLVASAAQVAVVLRQMEDLATSRAPAGEEVRRDQGTAEVKVLGSLLATAVGRLHRLSTKCGWLPIELSAESRRS